MKTSFWIILVGFFVSVFWIVYLGINVSGEIMVDGITVSAAIVTSLAVVFSVLSWFLLSWAFKSMNLKGVMLSVIIGIILITPFNGVLGPMAGIVVGLVAGFVASMIEKKMINPSENKPMIIAIATLVMGYVILFTIVSLFQANHTSHIWDTGDGIGTWTGTPEGFETP